jgi:ribosomal subunit interface protein
MNINIKTTNITLTSQISDYVDKRLEKIKKLVSDDMSAQCDIELGKTSEHHQKGDIFRAEIHVIGVGKNAYASTERNDLYSAIDDVKDQILRKLKDDKGKKMSLVRRSGIRVKNMVRGLWSWRKRGSK